MQMIIFAETKTTMKDNYSISIFLDTRRKLQSGKFPVKLRIYTNAPRKQKLYLIGFEMTKTEFASVWESVKPRAEHKRTRLELLTIETEANEIAASLNPFTFENFEREMFGAKFDKSNVIEHYIKTIEVLRTSGQISTSVSYDSSLKSILNFLESKGKRTDKLSFYTITPQFLNEYEIFMLTEGKSTTTIGIYLRPLRAIFNAAIGKIIDRAYYPFGKDKFKIPAGKKTKKAFKDRELKLLFDGQPKDEYQAKAKAFWFFSFSCNGMNIKDILNLKFKDFQNDSFSFIREKTKNTSETPQEITVILTPFAKSVISEYGNPNQAPKNFVFPFVDRTQSQAKQHAQVQNFTRFINQHFKKYAASLGITSEVSTYWARHSFATRAIRNKASMEFVSEALGHSDLKTTKGYFAGFESDQKKEFAEALMNF